MQLQSLPRRYTVRQLMETDVTKLSAKEFQERVHCPDSILKYVDASHRPLFEIGKEVFLKDGHYNGYYCYDLREWKGTEGSHTSFDLSMFKTLEFLKENDMPTLQYSSHQPQIIDRDIYRELINRYRGIEETGLDEWSVYFNYGVKNYPDLFRPQIYISMCWPGSKTDWNLYVQPKENYSMIRT